ncbi:TPA: TraY domain-containing protein [Legionella pneumophila]
MESKLESNSNYNKVHITILLSENANRLLSQSCIRSNRKKIQEATLRLEDHLKKFRSISEIDYAIPLNGDTE